MKLTDPNTRKSGFLDVGDGHKIYWEDWGNPKSNPIIHFHGGPGGGTNESHKLLFDPARHRVIFFDQRGSGKSKPYASTKNNTTQNLVEDTEKLRKHLKLGKIHLVGGSWGSTMTLMYALTYPENVNKMVSWGIYLGSKFENDLISAGYHRYNYPEAWERFITLVPEKSRNDGNSITKYYSEKINSKDKKIAIKHADEWTLWEATLISIRYDKLQLESEVLKGDDSNLAVAKLETHYFLNNCFIPDNYIIDNINRINAKPLYVVQGRFDNCTPPISAYKLSNAYGSNMTLQFVNSGHSRSDPEQRIALRAVINTTLI
jgi:proline iminopeptidase